MTGVTTSSFVIAAISGGDFKIISHKPENTEIAGWSEKFKIYFKEYINQLAEEHQVLPTTIEQEVKDWYEGFTFTSGLKTLYNSDSIGNYFWNKQAKIYWTDHGRPTFLCVKSTKEKTWSLYDLSLIHISEPTRPY